MPFNITNSIQVYDDSSMNPPEYEQARCSSHFLTLIFHTQPTLLIIFGFLANLFSFVVLTRPRLRRRPTFSYLAFLSLSNSFLSLIHASFTILGFYFGLTLDNLSLFIFCRFLNRFAIDFLTHFSLYTLTAVDLDRRLKKSRRRMELHLSILLISLNCVFILFTTPHNIYSVYIGQLQRRLVNRQKSEEELCSISILQKSLDLLQQCYFMSTFFLYILTNKRFREEFWDLIKTNLFFARKIKKRENSSTEITTRRRHHRHRQSEIDSITQLDHVDQRNQSIVESPMSIVNDFTQDDVEDE
ncbi:unnamed protein product [Rotaria socialis]|uniref:G-protein coupled receptors family 1 profile domain-containing protein n=1 Tax=Rotaria socialis TaxID=392032 RepID=A0A821UJX5_9BILA|nr:unnamed protein product [Rotaria socialis]